MTAEAVAFPSGTDEIRGYAARPAGSGPFPGLVLIPDVRGLADHYRDVARRFAAEGFFTLAVDLYSREGTPDLPDMAAVFRVIRHLPDPRVLGDLGAAVEWLAGQAEVRPAAIGVTGYCMGGQYALLAACTVQRLAACVSWYGMLRYTDYDDRNPATCSTAAATSPSTRRSGSARSQRKTAAMSGSAGAPSRLYRSMTNVRKPSAAKRRPMSR